MKTKVCAKCKIEKDVDEFHKRTISKDGLKRICKECSRIEKLKYRLENPNKGIEYRKVYYINNIEKIKKYNKDNNGKIKKYRKDNKEKTKLYNQEYKKNKITSEYQRKYVKNKKKSNPIFKLKVNFSTTLRMSFKQYGYTKRSRTFVILGCSFDDFRTYLESKFETWMNWENKGLYNGEFKYGWDIDHITPQSTAKNEDEFIKLNHYTNLQPLCSKINREIKRNKV